VVTGLVMGAVYRGSDDIGNLVQRGSKSCQYLWIGESQATSEPTLSVLLIGGSGVMSTGGYRSLPLWKTAPGTE
jgi:hypothetical protein